MVVCVVTNFAFETGEVTRGSGFEPRTEERSKVETPLDCFEAEVTEARMPQEEVFLSGTEVAVGFIKDGEVDLGSRARGLPMVV